MLPKRLTVATTFVADPAAVNVKLAVVKVDAVIAVLKVATTAVFSATPVALFAGAVVVTTGAAAVVKFHV